MPPRRSLSNVEQMPIFPGGNLSDPPSNAGLPSDQVLFYYHNGRLCTRVATDTGIRETGYSVEGHTHLIDGLNGASSRFATFVLKNSTTKAVSLAPVVNDGGTLSAYRLGSEVGSAYWTSPFAVGGAGRGAHWSTDGYFYIQRPAEGTAIPIVGGSTTRAVSNGIPMYIGEVLYYILPVGSSSASLDQNFRILPSNVATDFSVPEEWVAVATVVGSNLLCFMDGRVVSPDDPSASGDPYPFYARRGHLLGDHGNVLASAAVSGNFLKYNGSNWVPSTVQLSDVQNGPYFKAAVPGGGSVPANSYNVPWVVQEDPDGRFNSGATKAYTVPIAGIYEVVLNHKTNSTQVQSVPIIQKNGAIQLFGFNNGSPAFGGNTGVWSGRCAAGDVLQVTFNAAFVTQADGADNTTWTIKYVGSGQARTPDTSPTVPGYSASTQKTNGAQAFSNQANGVISGVQQVITSQSVGDVFLATISIDVLTSGAATFSGVIYVDGVINTDQGHVVGQTAASQRFPLSKTYRITNLAPGNHTIDAAIGSNSGTIGVQQSHTSLVVEKVASGLVTPTEPAYVDYETGSPTLPTTGLRAFTRKRARRLPAIVDPQGHDVTLQPSLASNKFTRWGAGFSSPTIVTDYLAASVTSSGGTTPTSVTTSTGTILGQAARVRLATTATAGTVGSARGNALAYFLSTSAGMGGFHFVARFGYGTALPSTGTRSFVGLHASTAAILASADPAALLNMIGVGWAAADTPRFYLHTNDGSGTATKTLISEFSSVVINELYELQLYAVPGVGTVYWSLRSIGSNINASGTITADLPALNTMMTPHFTVANGSLAAAYSIDMVSMTCETDN